MFNVGGVSGTYPIGQIAGYGYPAGAGDPVPVQPGATFEIHVGGP